MNTFEQRALALLDKADIKVNGSRPWDIQVHNTDFFRRVLSQGSLGLGESYMDGWWDVKALDEFIAKVLAADLDDEVKNNFNMLWQLPCLL